MHLEVFAGSEFKAFVEACRALDAGLDPNATGSPKTLLAIEKGAVLKAGPPPNAKLDKGEIVMRAKDSKEDGPWIKLERGNVEVLKHTPTCSKFDRYGHTGRIKNNQHFFPEKSP